MNAHSATIDRWRKFFRSADGDIFDVLEFAIVVAASDCPDDFRIRRGEIAQKLFACGLLRSADCESVSVDGDDGSEEFRAKERKVVSSSSDDDDERNRTSNYRYDDAEALTMEIEESSQIVDEVLRIKLILEDPDESDSSVSESLRRLQLMELSVDILQATEVGRAVSRLKKRTSNQIRSLAKMLISGWKNMVDEWVQTTNTVCGDSPDYVNPPTMGEGEGLPSPPLDEGAFLTADTTLELSKFFDGMDDDEKPRDCGGHGKSKEQEKKSKAGKDQQKKKAQNAEEYACREGRVRKEEVIVNNKQANVTNSQAPKENSCPGRLPELVGKEESVAGNRQTKATHSHTPVNSMDPGRPPVKSIDKKLITKPKLKQRPDCMQKTASVTLQDKSKCSDDMLVKVKLEAAKRKLHEGYQQAENAKKQRTIQVMELHDLPKQGLLRRNPHPKPGFHNRKWNNKRH